MALWEGEHGLMGQVNETAAIGVFALIFLHQLVKVNCFVSHVLRALLVILEAEGMSALVHVHGAETEAKNIKLTRLSWALTVALTIDQLLIGTTLLESCHAWFHAGAIVFNHAVWADWCTHIALSHNKAGWALRVPLVLALLALAALLLLAVSTPQRKRLLATKLCYLEELGAGQIIMMAHDVTMKRLVVGGSSLALSLLSLSSWSLSSGRRLLASSALATLTLTVTALATLLSASVTTSTRGRSVTIVYRLLSNGMATSAMSRGSMCRLRTVRASVTWHLIANVGTTAVVRSRLGVHRLSRVSAGPSAATALTMGSSASRVRIISVGVALRALLIIIGAG